MKKPMLVRLSVVVEADPEDPQEGGLSEINRAMYLLRDAINERLCASDMPDGTVYSMQSFELDESELNCGRCATCGSWTTDCEQPEPILDLGPGARVDGKLYCDEDLPPDHPLAF